MPSVHCGDAVAEKIGFSDFKKTAGDRQALVMLTRDPDEVVKNFVLDVQNNEVEVKWPDLEKGDDYWGGAKAYLDGGGNWKQKWDRQIYFFEVIVGNLAKKSDTIMVDPLPDKGLETKTPSYPCVFYTEGFSTDLGDRIGLKKLPKFLINVQYSSYALGAFDLEFKRGEVLIKLALTLNVPAGAASVPGNLFDIFKRTVEEFWNGPNGFGGFAFHRKACVRKKDCDCKIAYDLGDNVISGGCCKIPVRLEVEESSRHGQSFNIHPRGFGAGIRDCAPFADGVTPGEINYPEVGTNTWAHEVGHCLGFPDQYLGGAMWENHPAGKFPQKRNSIMGARQSKADEDHLVYVEEYMGSDFTIIRETINR